MNIRTSITSILLIAFLATCSVVNGQSKKQKELEQRRQEILQQIRQINVLMSQTKKEEKSRDGEAPVEAAFPRRSGSRIDSADFRLLRRR